MSRSRCIEHHRFLMIELRRLLSTRQEYVVQGKIDHGKTETDPGGLELEPVTRDSLWHVIDGLSHDEDEYTSIIVYGP
jgi:hypothetical protein